MEDVSNCSIMDYMKFYLYLENGNIYLMNIGFNFHKYSILKGCLYKNGENLGKIIKVTEELKHE